MELDFFPAQRALARSSSVRRPPQAEVADGADPRLEASIPARYAELRKILNILL